MRRYLYGCDRCKKEESHLEVEERLKFEIVMLRQTSYDLCSDCTAAFKKWVVGEDK